MPNGREHRKLDEYGSHSYNTEGTSDCIYKCGCWCGPARSGGPLGINPLGNCPNNPLDGNKQSGKLDYEDVVIGRITKLENEIVRLREFENIVKESTKNSKVDLIKRTNMLTEALSKYKKSMELIEKEIISITETISIRSWKELKENEENKNEKF